MFAGEVVTVINFEELCGLVDVIRDGSGHRSLRGRKISHGDWPEKILVLRREKLSVSPIFLAGRYGSIQEAEGCIAEFLTKPRT